MHFGRDIFTRFRPTDEVRPNAQENRLSRSVSFTFGDQKADDSQEPRQTFQVARKIANSRAFIQGTPAQMTSVQDGFRHALSAMQQGRAGIAERLFRQVLQLQPKHVGALNLLCILLTSMRRFEEAESYAKRALKEDASSDASFHNYGIILKALGRPGEALERFSQALKINPKVAETWNNRGTTFNDLKRHQEAIADFDRAIAINSNYADAFLNKGNAHADLKNYAESLAAYEKALALKPELPDAWLGRGKALTGLELFDEALTAYDRALSLEPNLVAAWLERGKSETRAYRKWIEAYDLITPGLRSLLAVDIAKWPTQPLISVIMPSYNIDPKWMIGAIESVRSQIYPYWELCISDDASTTPGIRPLLEGYAAREPRIRVTFRSENGHISVNSNAALALANGDYVALMDADDVLSEDALFWMAREIMLHPEADLFFSDEDKIDQEDTRFEPYFKSAWNPALMLSHNAFSHLGVYRRRLVEEAGRFREGYEGSQDYDLVLRCAAKTTADRIRHIPRVLYHWRTLPNSTAAALSAKPYAWEAGRSAISDHLQDARIDALVKPALGGFYQVDYSPPKPLPLVSVLVPSKLDRPLTVKCLASLLRQTTYGNFELVVLVQAEHLEAVTSNPDVAVLLSHSRVRCANHDEVPFNFSRVNNLGVRAARGDLLCFVNDDIEVINKGWLERLVARVMLDGVGAAGPMLYYPSDSIQHAGFVLGVGGIADQAFKGRPRGYHGTFGRGALEQDYSAVTAACMLVRRKVFEQVGGFDETLPVAFNDLDLCMRIRQTGARIVWTPTVEMYHHESLTFGHDDSAARSDQFRNDMWERWRDVLEGDPYYSPNFSLVRGSMFSLAWPPRVPSPQRLVTDCTKVSISRTSQLNLVRS
jgi:O-antigen biosynthesis protein